jgi:ABC-type branched-subunit amino acid transport system substrate-binding protein
LRRAGKKLDRETFVKAMESMSEFDVGGFKVSYGPENHNGSKFVDLTIISKDQRFVR